METKTPPPGAQDANFQVSGGEDESSTEREGDDSHLHDDQKSPSYPSVAPDADAQGRKNSKGDNRAGGRESSDAGADDQANDQSPTRVEDLAKAGRPDLDTGAGQN